MVSLRLAASLLAIFLIGSLVTVRAEEMLNVENWPGDVPCNVLKKHPDGTYEITVAWSRFFQRHAPGNTATPGKPPSGTRSVRARPSRTSGPAGFGSLRLTRPQR